MQNEKDEQPKLFVLPTRLLLLLIIHLYEKEAKPVLFLQHSLKTEQSGRAEKKLKYEQDLLGDGNQPVANRKFKPSVY